VDKPWFVTCVGKDPVAFELSVNGNEGVVVAVVIAFEVNVTGANPSER
jgi:hypothetical protein